MFGCVAVCTEVCQISVELELKRSDGRKRRAGVDDLAEVLRPAEVPMVEDVGEIDRSEQVGLVEHFLLAIVEGGVHADIPGQFERRLAIGGILTLENPVPLALRVHTDAGAEPLRDAFLEEVGRPEAALVQRAVWRTAAFCEEQIFRHTRVDVGIVRDDVPSRQDLPRDVELHAFAALFSRRDGEEEPVERIGRQHILLLDVEQCDRGP